MKRFWKEVATSSGKNAFGITLDGKPIKTPAGAELLVPNANLAEAIAKEWNEQGENVEPYSMPMFQFSLTALDRVAPQRHVIIDEIASYGASDLLCYREAQDRNLKQHQQKVWQPYLAWFEEQFEVSLSVTEGVMPISQSPQAIKRMGEIVAKYDNFALAGLHSLTTLTGSLVLGMAVAKEYVSAEKVTAAAFLDMLWQQEKWGADEEAEQLLLARIESLLEAERYLALL